MPDVNYNKFKNSLSFQELNQKLNFYCFMICLFYIVNLKYLITVKLTNKLTKYNFKVEIISICYLIEIIGFFSTKYILISPFPFA